MKISFIIANYNRISFVERSLKSFLEFKGEKELIVVDGLSTDGSFEYLAPHADIIISERDSSVYEAWNKALDRATGDWIFFLNTDDQLLPDFDKIYELLPRFSKYEIIRFRVEIENQNRPKHISLRCPLYSYSEIISSPIYFNGYIFASNVFKKIGKFDESFKYCADQDFLWRCKEQGVTSKVLKNIGYRYTMHSNSLTISSTAQFFDEEKQIAELRFASAKNGKSKIMAKHWIEWEAFSGRYANNKVLRTLMRLLNTKTFLIQLFQINLKINLPVTRLFY